MTNPAVAYEEISVKDTDPQELLARLSSRLRIHYNRETGRHTATFAGVYEKLANDQRMVVQGVAKTDTEACRALAMRMRELQQLGRLQVLA